MRGEEGEGGRGVEIIGGNRGVLSAMLSGALSAMLSGAIVRAGRVVPEDREGPVRERELDDEERELDDDEERELEERALERAFMRGILTIKDCVL